MSIDLPFCLRPYFAFSLKCHVTKKRVFWNVYIKYNNLAAAVLLNLESRWSHFVVTRVGHIATDE